MYQVLLILSALTPLCSGQVDYSNISKSCIEKCCNTITNNPKCYLSDKVKIDGCPFDRLVRDQYDCCFVCPKGPGETCGGYKAKYGRCTRKYSCLHETIAPQLKYLELSGLQGHLQEGKCISMKAKAACRKDCCGKPRKLICGSDGKWYLNSCFRIKADCFRPNGAPEIRKYNGKDEKDDIAHCGTPPPDCIHPEKICSFVPFAGGERPILYYSPSKHSCSTNSPTKNTVTENNKKNITPTTTHSVVIQPSSSPEIGEE